MCTYGLGVFDKTAQNLKIVPIVANRIFRLEPRGGGVDQPEIETPHEMTSAERVANMRELTLKYSSKKAIRRVEKLDSLRLVKLARVEINKDALEIADMTKGARNIPSYDMAATTPETAYPLTKIIFEGDWDYLLDIQKLSSASNVYPSFVCNRVFKLDNIKDEMEKRKLAGIFSYTTHLVKFKDTHHTSCQISKPLVPEIFSHVFPFRVK